MRQCSGHFKHCTPNGKVVKDQCMSSPGVRCGIRMGPCNGAWVHQWFIRSDGDLMGLGLLRIKGVDRGTGPRSQRRCTGSDLLKLKTILNW